MHLDVHFYPLHLDVHFYSLHLQTGAKGAIGHALIPLHLFPSALRNPWGSFPPVARVAFLWKSDPPLFAFSENLSFR